jgi:uncharacterized protein YqgV (UPF0045/DUF77 family)
MGAPRVFTVLKAGTRIDRTQTMEEKISSVEKKLRRNLPPRQKRAKAR